MKKEQHSAKVMCRRKSIKFSGYQMRTLKTRHCKLCTTMITPYLCTIIFILDTRLFSSTHYFLNSTPWYWNSTHGVFKSTHCYSNSTPRSLNQTHGTCRIDTLLIKLVSMKYFDSSYSKQLG